MDIDYDIIVAGAGPVGLAAALSLRSMGWRVAIADPAPEDKLADPQFDGREIAMTYRTRDVLKRLGVWRRFDPALLCPLREARIETGDLGGEALIFSSFAESFKNPENRDKAVLDADLEPGGKPPLGWLMSNHLIRRALYEGVKDAGIPLLAGDAVTDFKLSPDRTRVSARFESGRSLSAKLLVAADGRFSNLRDKAGIGVFMQDFHKSVLVCRVKHAAAHDDVALQWFDHAQTLAFLPVRERMDDGLRCSSIVLMLPPEEIGRLNALDAEAFSKEITRRTAGYYGDCALASPKIVYPLKTVYAHRFYADRVALVGDAAIGMHPVTAHGFNFGVMAQDMLARALEEGVGADPADPRALRRFSHALRRKTFPMYTATNVIAKLYSRTDRIASLARKGAIKAAQRFTPFRRRIVNALMEAS